MDPEPYPPFRLNLSNAVFNDTGCDRLNITHLTLDGGSNAVQGRCHQQQPELTSLSLPAPTPWAVLELRPVPSHQHKSDDGTGLGGGGVCEGLVAGGPPPPVVPLPKHIALTPYTTKCVDDDPGVVYDNDGFADGNGPRGAGNASDCCAQCAAQDGCKFWSYNVDDAVTAPHGVCHWGALSYCCFFHRSSTNRSTLSPTQPSARQFGAKGKWQSGSVQPAAAAAAGLFSGVGPSKTELVLSSAATRIVATTASLLPLAKVLSDDIFALSGVRLNATGGSAGVGDIALTQRGSDRGSAATSMPMELGDESYSLLVSGKGAQISCESYTGCAWGVSTLLQLLCVSGVPFQTIALPAVKISDAPDAPYRAMLLDTARSLVTFDDLLEAVTVLRLYKIRYLHLHLTDDHAWSFPSDAYPQLGSANSGFRGMRPIVYTKEQLKALVAFADARGVTVVPELEGPGHSSAQRRAMPELFGPPSSPQGGGVLTVTNETTLAAMKTIVGEMAEIFASSPFIHVGCDETGTPTSLPGYDGFAAKHNISGAADLFAFYVKFMADSVRATGKTAIIWGPASLDRLEPDDAVVMVWNGGKSGAEAALKRNLSVINCPNEGGSLTQEYLHDLYDFGDCTRSGQTPSTAVVNRTSRVLGTQVNIWEVGWGYAQAARPAAPGASKTPEAASATSYVQQQVARTSGPGWWANTWPRSTSNVATGGVDAEAFVRAYAAIDRLRFRLQPQCHASLRQKTDEEKQLVAKRPPFMSALQRGIVANISARAAAASAAATAELLAALDGAALRSSLRQCCPQVAKLPAAQLLAAFEAEAQVAEITHNLQARTPPDWHTHCEIILLRLLRARARVAYLTDLRGRLHQLC